MKIYTSPYCEFLFEAKGRVLSMIWNKECGQLDEEGVKSEIGRILKYIDQYGVINVIVDSRNYQFRDNATIQSWIHQTYVPQLVDGGILKYAIVVHDQILKELKKSPDESEDDDDSFPRVEYFTRPDEAQNWIESSIKSKLS